MVNVAISSTPSVCARLRNTIACTAADEPLAEVGGVDVHAKVAVGARDHPRRERPPLAQDRLTLEPDGRVRLAFKAAWKDGTHAVLLDPLDLIARLCALVPPPRFHLLRYHGVLAAHSSVRAEIVPGRELPSPPAQLPLFQPSKMAKHAAEAEHVSVSAMVERAIRLVCGEYVAHEVRVDLLERETAAIRVRRKTRTIFSVRTDTPGVLASIEASVRVGFFGPVEPHGIAAALRECRVPGKARVQSGQPIELSCGPYAVVVDSFTIGLASPNALNHVLDRAAAEVSRLGSVRFGSISSNRCTQCQSRIVAVAVWAPRGVIEHQEWTCALGHVSHPSAAQLNP